MSFFLLVASVVICQIYSGIGGEQDFPLLKGKVFFLYRRKFYILLCFLMV